MSILSIVLTIAIVGFCLWVILQIPMPQLFKNIIYGIVAIFLIIWVLQVLGVATGFPAMHLRS